MNVSELRQALSTLPDGKEVWVSVEHPDGIGRLYDIAESVRIDRDGDVVIEPQ